MSKLERLNSVSVMTSNVGSTHMTPREDYVRLSDALSEIESLRAELAALQAEPAVEPVPMTDQEFTAWIESCGFVIEPHTAWTIKELVERHHNIKPKGE